MNNFSTGDLVILCCRAALRTHSLITPGWKYDAALHVPEHRVLCIVGICNINKECVDCCVYDIADGRIGWISSAVLEDLK